MIGCDFFNTNVKVKGLYRTIYEKLISSLHFK